MTKDEFKQYVNHPYEHTYGPMHLVMADGGALCHSCARREQELIESEIEDRYEKQWIPVGKDINREDDDLRCDHCYDQIEPQYG